MRCKGTKVASVLLLIGMAGCSSKSGPTVTGAVSSRSGTMPAATDSAMGLAMGPRVPHVASADEVPVGRAVSAMGGGPAQSTDAFGFTGLVASSLERVPVHPAHGEATPSAWRMEIKCDQGAGSIVREDSSADPSHFRGDGLFVGWCEARLAELFATLVEIRGANQPSIEFLQPG
jgi:hypothetical protein